MGKTSKKSLAAATAAASAAAATDRYAPHNCPKFQALCDVLRRNDPSVTVVCATKASTTPAAYGRRIGMALQKNTLVSEIHLNLACLLSKADRKAGTSESVSALLEWIERSPSLRVVTLRYKSAAGNAAETKPSNLFPEIFRAMTKNPALRELDFYLPHFPMPLLTKLVQTNAMLQSLKMEVNYWSSDVELTDAAQALASLESLEVLELTGSNLGPFSGQFSDSRRSNVLKELTLDFKTWTRLMKSTAAQLSTLLSGSRKLTSLTLKHLVLESDCWTHIASGLASNPSIIQLSLHNLRFSEPAASLFLQHFQSGPIGHVAATTTTSLQQHVRRLILSGCHFPRSPGTSVATAIAEMLSASLLHHVSLDSVLIRPHEELAFFSALTARGSSAPMRIRSMELNGMSPFVLQYVASYLPVAIYLQRLSIKVDNSAVIALAESGPVDTAARAFVSNLGRNFSLHSIEIAYSNPSANGDPLGQAHAMWRRWIQVFTDRNRCVPQAFESTTSAAAAADREVRNDAMTHLLHPKLYNVCMMPAQRMTGNTLLLGLLKATTDELDRKRSRDELSY